jgi:hypothetical protein
MRANGRPKDPHFHRDEYLFRRVPTQIWDDPSSELGVEAVALPDLSVGRSKYSHAEWVRFDTDHNHFYASWAVVGIQVDSVPAEIWKEGVFHFTFRVIHDPDDKNYPHSVVSAFENDKHINLLDNLPEDLHLKWREKVLRRTETIIKPFQKVRVRQQPPTSHKLEPFTEE